MTTPIPTPTAVAEAAAILSQFPCPCSGRYDLRAEKHFVWVAFLHYDNDEFRQEQCARDYLLLPTNRLACALSRSDIYHCQMMFWHHAEGAFETVSVDAHRGCVHSYKQKEFARGWTFYRLEVDKWQEMAMWAFSQRQVGKPINKLGLYLVPVMPTSGQGEKWFCAELVMRTLQMANLFVTEKPEAMFPSTVRDLIRDSAEVPFYECNHPIRFRRARKHLGLDQCSGDAIARPPANGDASVTVRSFSFSSEPEPSDS